VHTPSAILALAARSLHRRIPMKQRHTLLRLVAMTALSLLVSGLASAAGTTTPPPPTATVPAKPATPVSPTQPLPVPAKPAVPAALHHAAAITPGAPADNAPFFTGHPDAATFKARMTQRLTTAKAALARMLAVKGTRTIANTLMPFDEIARQMDMANSAVRAHAGGQPRLRHARERRGDDAGAVQVQHRAVAQPRRV
jgi:hypothetical protein